MIWKIAKAKEQFSDLIHASIKAPQFIYNRDRAVAVIITPEEFDEYMALKKKFESKSLLTAFEELHAICAEENYTFAAPDRKNRDIPGF